jgi:hypothetical protein
MVGILDHATFSNIREQHKNLYQDSLGPWLRMIQDDIDLQLLPEFGGTKGVYTEFNIEEKLRGSFEEQMGAFQTAVGRPWMAPNEARAKLNMPRSETAGADDIGIPLNIIVPGTSVEMDEGEIIDGELTGPEEVVKALLQPDRTTAALLVNIMQRGAVRRIGSKARRTTIDASLLRVRERHVEKWTEVLERTFKRQEASVIGRVPAKQATDADQIWDGKRWNRELMDDLYRLNYATAVVWGEHVAGELGNRLEHGVMEEWLRNHARVQAEYVNGFTRDRIADALTEDEPRSAVRTLFEFAVGVRAAQIARSGVTSATNFGAQEGAKQGGLRTKTWRVNSGNPRDEHAAMNGETVGIREPFSNGMMWPGDPSGGADENANCMCSVDFGR